MEMVFGAIWAQIWAWTGISPKEKNEKKEKKRTREPSVHGDGLWSHLGPNLGLAGDLSKREKREKREKEN